MPEIETLIPVVVGVSIGLLLYFVSDQIIYPPDRGSHAGLHAKRHSAQLHIRLTPEHDELIREAAERSGQTLTNWIRGVLVKAAQRLLDLEAVPHRHRDCQQRKPG